jgi:hypothetical protein
MVHFSGGVRDFCHFQKHPNWLWGLPSFLHGGYWGLFLWVYGGWIMKLTIDLRLVLRLHMSRYVRSLSLCLHGMHRDNFTFTFTFTCTTYVTPVLTVYVSEETPMLTKYEVWQFQKRRMVGGRST